LNISEKIQADLSNLKIKEKIPINNFKLNENLLNLETKPFEINSSISKLNVKEKNFNTNTMGNPDRIIDNKTNNNMNYSFADINNLTVIKENNDSQQLS